MKFSVLLPTRNGAAYLDYSIRSILAQNDADFELVIADNASELATQEVINRYRGDPRIRVVRTEQPVPVTDNWNNALHASNGDYLLMMGDDDAMLPQCLPRLRALIAQYQAPDCILYNAYSYVAPQSIQDNTHSLYAVAHFHFGQDLAEEQAIERAHRQRIVRDMFRFRVRIPLNMQTTLVSRTAAEQVPGGMFQAPFPDHFALNSLLLLADRWLFIPERLLVVGVSPKSFGHFVYSHAQPEGLDYLGVRSAFPGCLPGSELTNGMHAWLNLLLKRYPEHLGGVRVDRAGYVRRQFFVWLMQWRSGVLTAKDLFRYFCLLEARDWRGLIATLWDGATWNRLRRLAQATGKSDAEKIWHGLSPIPEVQNIFEFTQWVDSKGRRG